jgi:serine/threonine protein kinase
MPNMKGGATIREFIQELEELPLHIKDPEKYSMGTIISEFVGNVYNVNNYPGLLMKEVEINFIDNDAEKDVANATAILNELEALQKIYELGDHPNIMKYHGFYIVGNKVYIVMEKCKGVDGLDFASAHTIFTRTLSVKNFINIIHGLLQGLVALEGDEPFDLEKVIFHRDIKVDNFMIYVDEDEFKECKWIDFGHAGNEGDRYVGTPSWTHLHKLLRDLKLQEYTANYRDLQMQFDCYSFCLTIVTLLKGQPYSPPYNGGGRYDLYMKLARSMSGRFFKNREEADQITTLRHLSDFIKNPNTYLLTTGDESSDVKNLNDIGRDQDCEYFGDNLELLFNNLLGWNGETYVEGHFEKISFKNLLDMPLFKECGPVDTTALMSVGVGGGGGGGGGGGQKAVAVADADAEADAEAARQAQGGLPASDEEIDKVVEDEEFNNPFTRSYEDAAGD